MCEHELYLQPEGCKFKKTRIKHLSSVISHNKVKIDPVKITGVADWLTPSNKKEVQSFISFVNFYCQITPGFLHDTCTLFDLTMKDVRFIWGMPQEDSFMKLKELITSAPVLVLPDDDLPFRLKADGSGITTGAVLSQQSCKDNAWHPVAFLSKALNPVEQNYTWRYLPSSEDLKSGDTTSKVLTTLSRSGPITRTSSTFAWPRSSIDSKCKGTSFHFLTSPLLSHSPLVHMYSPFSPLYQFQGLHLELMTFQKSTHQ
jgi:hypothetical protein